MKTAEYHGFQFVGGYQFWSNPALEDTEAAIPIVLMRPTLLDLITLSIKFGSDELIKQNEILFQSNEMDERLYKRNLRRLLNIKRGIDHG